MSQSKVLLENDLRAFANPTRMQNIRTATVNLSEKMRSLCPKCCCPGFWITKTISGLHCIECGNETREIKANIYECKKCSHQEEVKSKKEFAEPNKCKTLRRIKINKFKLVITSLIFASISNVYAQDWSYDNDSIKNWGNFEGASLCSTGTYQSPINIETYKVIKTQLPKLVFNYINTNAEVINTGKTIRVDLSSKANRLLFGDKEYKLLQFHFHTPSEEAINGKRYPLVAHFVHQNDDGQILVIAQPFNIGNENDLFKNLFEDLPNNAEKKSFEVDLNKLFQKKISYFNYQGSRV